MNNINSEQLTFQIEISLPFWEWRLYEEAENDTEQTKEVEYEDGI